MKDYLRGFMNLEIGKSGMKLSFSHFGLILLLFVTFAMAYASYKTVSREIYYKNLEIERFRQENEELKRSMKRQELIIERKDMEIERKDKEIEELSEYKNLIEAIKTFSVNILNEEQQLELAKVIKEESKKYKFNWRMIVALIMTESSFRHDIRSTDPSYGLMQIKLPTAKSAGSRVGIQVEKGSDLYDITTNVRIGGYYLWEQILKFGDVKKGIISYNLGPTKTSRIDREGRGEEFSTVYLERIWKRYQYLEENFSYK